MFEGNIIYSILSEGNTEDKVLTVVSILLSAGSVYHLRVVYEYLSVEWLTVWGQHIPSVPSEGGAWILQWSAVWG